MKRRIPPRVALLIIIALFVLPLLGAWLMYRGVIDYNPTVTRNLGQLVEPPRPLPPSALALEGSQDSEPVFAHHWVVLHVVPKSCDNDCLQVAADLRQVYLASGRNQSRLRLALLSPETDQALSARLLGVFDGFILLQDSSEALRSALNGIAGGFGATTGAAGATFLVDPLGNAMMYYAPGYDPNDIKADLKRLLAWSKADQQS